MFYGVLNPATGELIYSSAGHNPPAIVNRADKTVDFLAGCEGFPVKLVGPNMPYDNSTLHLKPGEHIILYTDGLVETFNEQGEPFSMANLESISGQLAGERPVTLIQSMLRHLDTFRGARPFDDDLSLLVISRD